MVERALSFGAVAAAYERFRPGYPDRLVDEVLVYAAAPVRSALEIGAGTGKATRAFAARGISVTASDPDPAMLTELRRHVPASVATIQASFEDLPLGERYDLVFAGAAMHWTRPEGRWARIAALLHARGVLASFGGQMHLDDSAVADAVRTAREPYLADDDHPSPDGTSETAPMQWPGTEISQSVHFTDVREVTIERPVHLSARDYIGHLSTISAYRQLSDETRAIVFERISHVLPAVVTLKADVVLHLARAVTPEQSSPDDEPRGG